jgi:hypothetical protein
MFNIIMFGSIVLLRFQVVAVVIVVAAVASVVVVSLRVWEAGMDVSCL